MSAFSYDADAPIGLTERGRDLVGGVSVRDVTFSAPVGGDITAYLVVPAGEGPFPGILFLHWGAGDRTEFLSESLTLAKAGAVSLLVDAPHNRPGWQPFMFGIDPDKERDFFVQVVVELRRAVDVLDSLAFVDSARLAYVGHSLGATVGGALAGVEERIGTCVLMGGLPRPLPLPGVGADVSRHYRDAFSSVSSQALIGQATSASLFFQFARYDRHVGSELAAEFVDAAGEPKAATWYLTSHEFNDPGSRRDRLTWIGQRLQLDEDVLRDPG